MVGEDLLTTSGTWTNSPTGYEYQWQRCDNTGSNCVDITNTFDAPQMINSPFYAVVDADRGHTIRAEVLARNDAGPAAGYAPSAPTSAIPAAVPTLSTAPVVSGTAAVGYWLSTTNGAWTSSPTSYQYEWQRCNSSGSNCVFIPYATSSQYKLVVADTSHEIRSVVNASNAAGTSESEALSAPTAAVVHKPAVAARPKVSGVAKVGNSLSVTTGVWKYSPASYAYQWWRCSVVGTFCKKIGEATSSSYLLAAVDAGHKLEANVRASNIAGSAAVMSNLSIKVRS
jgi:hypothetical protein